MHKRTVIVAMAILVALSPYIGLPYSLLMWVLPILGVIIAGTALSLKKRVAPPSEPIHEIPAGL